MTRSITIVNTSNYEHEDVEVNQIHLSASDRTVRLKPGDKMTVGPYGKDSVAVIRIEAIEEKEPIPFKGVDGKQDFPRVGVHKPRPSDYLLTAAPIRGG